ncbi:MAG TPA: L-seryl-tRNA(Sec) selenium transferase [Thermoanaerobaculia bacterium]|nr:L-seryl-tRNA(Sec) selenium transferase [Thermoanaerobaculia bacterium]
MGKAPATAADSEAGGLRSIPSVEKILSSPAFAALVAAFGREAAKVAVNGHLADLRAARGGYEEGAALDSVHHRLSSSTSSTLRRVINATGIIIHTNLGRAPIDSRIWSEAAPVVSGYSNLEFDLAEGERGRRDEHLSALCASLFGCQAAVLTNNNAAAALLLVAAVAAKKDVIVSRGELVEIGGSFRVPDVIRQGGARLLEVGTTNRTRAADYAAAVTRKTAAMLRVHRSNFDIVGFTETPSIEEMVATAREKRVPLLYDEGSGCIVDLSRYGFGRSETIRELIASGVDVVTCSTDKLIGATQGGLILGSAAIVDRVRKHPLMRALRAGKESYAVIAATLRAFATGRHEELVPIYTMLATPLEVLRERAAGMGGTIVESAAALGGGTTPAETIPSVAIAVPGIAGELRARFLALDPPIAGRISADRFTLDLRTVLPADLPAVAAALR